MKDVQVLQFKYTHRILPVTMSAAGYDTDWRCPVKVSSMRVLTYLNTITVWYIITELIIRNIFIFYTSKHG
jgi:hypothetical protein